jgi:arylsulfatase A-like enzyme
VAGFAVRPSSLRLAGLLAAAFFFGCDTVRDAKITAVVVIDIDTLRADGLSIYGNPRSTSPHLDAFAKRAARMEWAFAQAPYTLPSQASILTSLYPWAHGVWNATDRLASSAITLAEVFREGGWRTAAFVDGGFMRAEFGFDQGFDEYVDLDGGGLRRGEPSIEAWLEAHRRERFLLFVHTYDVHSPYSPPEPFRTRFAALAPDRSSSFEPTSEALEAIRASQWTDSPRQLSAADLAYARALYDGEVAAVDAWFGRLQEQLRRLGVDRRAAIAIVSDHGEEFQEHGSVLHERLYATVTRVPMLIGVPEGRGGVVQENVETIDLGPTLLELAGISPPAGMQGRSLAPTVRQPRRRPVSRPALSMSPFYGVQRSIALEDWHLIVTRDSGRLELFRYRQDPTEAVDLVATEAAARERLALELKSSFASTRGQGLVEPLEPSAEARARLRALGYLR